MLDPVWPEVLPSAQYFVDLLGCARGRDEKIEARGLHLVLRDGKYLANDSPESLLRTPYKPRADVQPVQLVLPIDWKADPFKDSNWKLQLNSVRFLDRFLGGYEKTGNTGFLTFPLAVLLDWHEFHLVGGSEGHYFAVDDMTAGIRAVRFAFIADKAMCGALQLTDEQRQKVAEVLLFHWMLFIRPGYFKFTNHTLSALHGLMALVRVARLEDGGEDEWMEMLANVCNWLVDAQFDDKGVHFENSPEYHFFVLRLFKGLLDSHWYDGLRGAFHEKLALARECSKWMQFPDGRALPIGDSNAKPAPQDATPLIAKRPDDNEATESFNSRMYHVTRCINTSDKGRWSTLAIKAGHDRRTHKHEDDLSYIWSESGRDLVVDPGKYAYTKDRIRYYISSARAHNVIEFKSGETVAKAAPHAPEPDVIQHAWGVEIRATAKLTNPDVMQSRRYFFCPGRWLLVVDRFSAVEDVTFTHWTHFDSGMRVDVDGEVWASDEFGGRLSVSSWCSAPTRTWVECGQMEPRIQGWISRAYKQVVPAPALAIGGRAREAIVIAGFSISEAGELTVSEDVARWKAHGEEIQIGLGV